MGQAAADRAGIRLDGPVAQAAPVEDAAVRVVHVAVLALAVLQVGVERVGVLHDELPPAHEAEARPDLVPELGLNLVQVERQVAVGTHLAADNIGDHFFVRRPEAEVAVVAVLDAQQLLAVRIPAPALPPQFRGTHRGHQDFLRSGAVHLLAHDGFDLAHHAQPERQEVVHPACDLPHHAGTQ